MAIKLTAREAIVAFNAIERLPRIQNPKIAYHLGYIGNQLESAARIFEKQRDKLSRSMSEEVEIVGKDGKKEKQRQIPKDKMEEFTEALEAMLEAEVSVDRNVVKLSEAYPEPPGGLSGEQLSAWEERYPRPTPGDMRALMKIIVE